MWKNEEFVRYKICTSICIRWLYCVIGSYVILIYIVIEINKLIVIIYYKSLKLKCNILLW